MPSRARERGRAAGGRRRPPRAATPATAVPHPVARRKPACTCGGTCPSCRAGPAVPAPTVRVAPPDDRHEREADRVAQRVMTAPVAAADPPITAAGPAAVQRKAGSDVPAAPAGERAGLGLTRGRPLAPAARAFHEPRLGTSLAGVRVHTGREAAAAAAALDARAFTIGRDIAFAAGEYAPGTDRGRRLLAHELVHVLQQAHGAVRLQRACDPAALAARTSPVFFPEEATLMQVFTGARRLQNGDFAPVAIGLVQQALVDLGYDLGTSGRRNDGVDRDFGSATESGIAAFQTGEAIPGVAAGVLDEGTLRCLDQIRSQREVPAHQTGTVTPAQYRIGDQRTGGRDEDIFFARGSSALDAADKAKIARLAAAHQGCALTLEGFISEDERVDFGPGLADDRLDAVSAEFAANHHDDPGACPHPVPPLRTKVPRPGASSGVGDYRARRKVEIVPPGATSQTMPCPPGAPLFRPLTAAEDAVLTPAVDDARDLLNTAIGKLTPGHAEGDPALTAYFGGTGRRSTIKTNLETWRDHVDNVVRANNRHGTQCNAVCDSAVAFNQGSGASAQMTVCPRFFSGMTVHGLSQPETRAFVIMHEAGHGSIRTRDTGYGHRRLIEFLARYPGIAETNTDSYTLMVLCLNGHAALCAPPPAADNPVGLGAGEAEKARRGLAWLQTWLIWGSQDTSSLYRRINTARQGGRTVRSINTYYADVFDTLIGAFEIHRAPGDAPPTFREQTTVAAIRDRLQLMQGASAAGLDVEKDTVAPLQMRWEGGGARGGPGRRLHLIDAYFALTTDRARVEALLPLIIAATARISAPMRPRYESFIKDNVRVSRNNRP